MKINPKSPVLYVYDASLSPILDITSLGCTKPNREEAMGLYFSTNRGLFMYTP